MKIGILGAVIMALLSYREARQERRASFKCFRYHMPQAQCEAHQVWPDDPIWRVYVPGTEDVADQEHGLVVYLTLPREKFALFEMCYGTQARCLKAYGGWFGGRLKFHRRGLEEVP